MKTFQLPQVARLAFCLLLIHLLISCDSLTSSKLTDQDREFFNNVYVTMGESWNSGDREPYLARYNDNTLHMLPNQEFISGLAAIRKRVNSIPDIKATFTVEEIWGNGSMANVRGTYTSSDNDGTMLSKGKFINLWQRDEAGNWKVTHDIWNSDLPVTNPIEGGWYLISGEYSGNKRGGAEPYQFKLFSDEHFALLMQTPGGEWKNSTTGSYSLSGDTYTETIEFSTDHQIGWTFDWKYSIDGDTLRMEGPIRILDMDSNENPEMAKYYNTMKEIRIRAK